MNIKPETRYPTAEAYASIIKKFGWRDESWMQDWPLEISHEIDIQQCIEEYPQLSSEDEKFVLMTGILYALDEVNDEALFEIYKARVREFLIQDFDIHKSTIYYWTLYENAEDHMDGFLITPLAREVWDAMSI